MLEVLFGSTISESVLLADAPLNRSGHIAAGNFCDRCWEFNVLDDGNVLHGGILYLELGHLLVPHGH
jgi:hypothetical protein